jgi:hypothetical protein
MNIDMSRMGSLLRQTEERPHESGALCSQRLLLWMVGLALGLSAVWLLWAAVDTGWMVGIVVGGAWLMNILIHVFVIDYLLRSVRC